MENGVQSQKSKNCSTGWFHPHTRLNDCKDWKHLLYAEQTSMLPRTVGVQEVWCTACKTVLRIVQNDGRPKILFSRILKLRYLYDDFTKYNISEEHNFKVLIT